ncbi:MAG TPA: hypothetical protein VFI31_24565 [Pirellulales bacterium]|nr:hypothetical protein [Pirellulales bacterium]
MLRIPMSAAERRSEYSRGRSPRYGVTCVGEAAERRRSDDSWHYVAAPRLYPVFATFSAGLHPRLHSFAAPRQTNAQHQN